VIATQTLKAVHHVAFNRKLIVKISQLYAPARQFSNPMTMRSLGLHVFRNRVM